MSIAYRFKKSRSVLIGGCAALLLTASAVAPAIAAGPFSDFPGSWNGTGKIRVQGKSPERLRCKASYRPRGSSAAQIDLQLTCDSDSYKFDLVGQFQADEGKVTGNWSENSRGVGGSVNGTIKGDRMSILVESNAFSASLTMVTRSKQQTVSFDAHGGGQVVDSTITLHR